MLGFSSISETAIAQLPESFPHSNVFISPGIFATLFVGDVLIWGKVVPGVLTAYSNVATGASQTYSNVATGASQTYTNVAVEASQTWKEEKR